MLLEVVAVAVLSNCMAQQRPSTCVPPACSWNAGKSQCEGICVSMTPEECKKTSFCKWELDTCTQGCSLNADDASCKADDSCFWLPAFGLCQDSPCKDKNFSTCGPMMCQYDFAARTCNPNPCYILPPSACTGSCITRDYQGTPYCGPPISEIFCNYPPNECERQTHCEQGQKRCAMKDVAALCSAFSKQLPCLEQKLCDWDGQACVPVGCFSYTTRDRCRDLDYCMWKETEHYCAESANSTTCNEVPQKQCANVPLGCRWEAQRCSECSGNTRDACRGGCVWSEPRGACMGTSCEKLDATECSVRPLCRWRARLNTCVSPEDLQCSSISEQATCDDVPSCQWGAAACSPVNIQCDQLTSDVKCKWHAGCRWDASARVCGSKDSCDVKEDDRCYKSPGCSWISNLEKCTPMQFPECNTTVAAKCPSSSCEWQADKTMCNPRLGCVGFEQQMCKGACTWRNDKCVKSGKSCDIFDLRTACEGSECLGVSPVWKTGPMKGQKPFIDGQALIEVSPGIVTNANGELICNLGESCEVCLPGHVLNMQKTVSCSGDDIIVNGQLCVKLQDLQLQWGGTDPYNPCDADSEATCDPATCVWKNANGKCVAIMECLQLTQQQCEKAAKCQWDAVCRDKDNEGCMRRECIGGVCTRVPLHGATCVTDDDKPGICATVANVVKCKSLPSFADDCAAKPCKGATDDPKQCQDPDRTKNGVYECTCQEGMRLDKTTKKCTSQGVCSRSMRSSCSRLKQDCEVVNGVEACQQPTCLDACANVPAGCTQRLDKAENGCLLFPCEFVCDTCTDDEHRECRVQAHQTKKSLECIKENSTASCITKPCPVPQYARTIIIYTSQMPRQSAWLCNRTGRQVESVQRLPPFSMRYPVLS